MPFDQSQPGRPAPLERPQAGPRRIAVIGGGISGLAAADALSHRHRVTLIEAAPRLGGHARTVLAGRRGDQPVDTGFIVFNKVNYPNLTALFDRLNVPVIPAEMSFGASIRGGRMEYGLAGAGALLAQRRNAADPRFWRMMRDIFRFNARAEALARDPEMTIAQLLDTLRTGTWFRDHYLLPFSGAIWSTPPQGILSFPARALVQFFKNHGLLGVNGQHQWYTVKGGSREYVRRLEADLAQRGVDIRLGSPVMGVSRDADGAEIRLRGGAAERFDAVVMATHSDDSLRLLSDPSPQERAALAAIRYQPNRAVLHADASVMPRRRAVWSSWNYTEDKSGPGERIDLTYWMNALQSIPKDDPLFVTLNGDRPLRDELVYDEEVFRHPVYDTAALEAQAQIRGWNGARNTWYCGAWLRNGFHEDGFATALDAVAGIEARDAAPLAAE